jgi:hypothetical protein
MLLRNQLFKVTSFIYLIDKIVWFWGKKPIDKIKRNQICRAILGLILLFIGLYLYSVRFNFTITMLVSLAGTAFLISSFKYKERKNAKKLTTEEKRIYVRSGYFLSSMIGAAILFTGLGGTALATYLNARPVSIGFLVITGLGMLIIVGARVSKRTDKKAKPSV